GKGRGGRGGGGGRWWRGGGGGNRGSVRKTALFTRWRHKPAPFLPRSNGDMWGVGNRSQPLGRDGSAHILGHCRQSWLEVPQGGRGSGGSTGAAARAPGVRRRPPRRRRGL